MNTDTTCPDCLGKGFDLRTWSDQLAPCPRCNGTGLIRPDDKRDDDKEDA